MEGLSHRTGALFTSFVNSRTLFRDHSKNQAKVVSEEEKRGVCGGGGGGGGLGGGRVLRQGYIFFLYKSKMIFLIVFKVAFNKRWFLGRGV